MSRLDKMLSLPILVGSIESAEARMIYEYECLNCGCFDVIASLDEWKPAVDCPNCGEESQQVFTCSPRVTRLNSCESVQAELERRSIEHSQKHLSDNLERIASGESHQGSVYNPKMQEQALLKRGKKLK